MLVLRESEGFTLSHEGFRSPTTPSPSPSPDSSSRCALSVSARAPLPLHRHPEPSEGSAFLSSLTTTHSPLATMFFRITSFADPHQLTSIESHSCKKQGEGSLLPGRMFFNRKPITRPRTEHAGTPASPILSCNSAHFPSHMGVYTPGPLIFEFPFSNFALSMPLPTTRYPLFTVHFDPSRNRAQERVMACGGHEK